MHVCIKGDKMCLRKQRIATAIVVVITIFLLCLCCYACYPQYIMSIGSIVRSNPTDRGYINRTGSYKYKAHTNATIRAQQCIHCDNVNPRNVCTGCTACDTCKIEDKCGSCQQFEQQTCLDEIQKKCILCSKKPCGCPTKTGKHAIIEPGVARNGIYSSCASNMIYI